MCVKWVLHLLQVIITIRFFMFEVKNTKNEAIKYLKDQRLWYITQLDTMFKNFIESYDILDTITTTLTNWVILTNYKEVDL